MKKYEIWIGNYSLGQGYDSPKEPCLLGEMIAINFKVACAKYELKATLHSIERQEVEKGYVDNQSLTCHYLPTSISNSWTGKYYESRKEALESFNK